MIRCCHLITCASRCVRPNSCISSKIFLLLQQTSIERSDIQLTFSRQAVLLRYPADWNQCTYNTIDVPRSITISWMQVLRSQPLSMLGLFFLAIFIVLAIFAPWIAPFDPAAIHLHDRLAGPSAAHWFGTDELGRDVLSRVIFGTRISMLVATSVV